MHDSVPSAGQRVVDVRHLAKQFGGQRALDDVSLSFHGGQVHGLAGQNGSGKSTLIKVLSGFHTPEPGGSLLVDGEEIHLGSTAASRAAGLRFVHQDLGLVDACSVWENVTMTAGFRHRRWGLLRLNAEKRRVRELLGGFGLADLDVDRPVGELSPVERTSLAIARALDEHRGEIRLLVLDEPTATLPAAQVDRLLDVVEGACERGIAVLYVTHRLDEMFRLASTISVLRDGRLIHSSPTEQLPRTELISLLSNDSLRADRATASGPSSRNHAPKAGNTTAGTPAVVKVRGLRTSRLRSVDLDVHPGEVLGIAGAFGSGREEVPYALAGALPAAFETLNIDGADIRGLSPRRAQALGIALVPGNRQPGSAVAEMSMRENVYLPPRGRRSPLIRAGAEVTDLTTWMETLQILPPFTERAFSQFSGGNQQKILLAKWLNVQPKVMLLDEPTAGVDVGARELIYATIRKVAEQGMAFVVASSDHSDLEAVCDRVLVLNRGELVSELREAQITDAAILAAASAGDHATPAVRTHLEEGAL